MRIGSIGYNYSHDKEFVMDRPNGTGCPLILLVKTDADFEIGGEKRAVRKNSFICFTPDMPCRYHSAGDVYTDDWMYLSMDSIDFEMFAKLGIPVNEPVYLGNIEELSQIVHILAYEHYSAEANHEEIEKRYLEIFVLKLGRAVQSMSAASPGLFAERNYKLTQLRTAVFTMPETIGSVDEMAEYVGMSRSGFQHLYKKMFGKSVISDVISGRTDRAKRLLSSTNLSVREISERCGYSGEYNFMRQFRKMTGKTPTEYRKSL